VLRESRGLSYLAVVAVEIAGLDWDRRRWLTFQVVACEHCLRRLAATTHACLSSRGLSDDRAMELIGWHDPARLAERELGRPAATHAVVLLHGKLRRTGTGALAYAPGA
jgi:hypothetical protein